MSFPFTFYIKKTQSDPSNVSNKWVKIEVWSGIKFSLHLFFCKKIFSQLIITAYLGCFLRYWIETIINTKKIIFEWGVRGW